LLRFATQFGPHREGLLSEAGIPTTAGRTPARVLVVEDDPSTADALRRLLRLYGYEVLLAESVREAHQQLATRPDHSLLDLMLPDGDGARVLEAVRQARLACRVVVITGVGDPDHLARVRGLNPEALLNKPVDFTQILEKLSRVA
jgi:DNA-binding response OmpR family regulator